MDVKTDKITGNTTKLPDNAKELCELPYFNIEELYGGNQELFHSGWMRVGGCAAVTACDTCIYLDMYKGSNKLYPFYLDNITKSQYEEFAMQMKPYLKPRYSGIDKLGIYIDGFGSYLHDHGCDNVSLTGFDGSKSCTEARAFVIKQIKAGYPIPYLNLRHKDPAFADFVWHWFLITGYAVFNEVMMVKLVSYGEYIWADFGRLWNLSSGRKGGMIRIEKHG